MIIDLSDIIKNGDGAMPLDCNIDLTDVDFMGEEFKFSAPLKLTGKILNNSKNLELSAEVSGSMQVHCARCAKAFETKVEFPVDEVLIREDENLVTAPDVIVFSGYEIDLTDIVVNNFLMNVPGRYLCREDCKGLCTECGCDLNESSCDCSAETIDPRWAALAEIIKDTTTE